MAKNILIFSDGTGQAGGITPDENVSNIYKLFRATRCGPDSDIDPSEQVTFYDPGLALLWQILAIDWRNWIPEVRIRRAPSCVTDGSLRGV